MSCASPGATHHAACDCREAAWAKRLAEAEERNRRLEEALLTGIEWLLDMAERKNHLVTPESCLAQAERLRALAPAPEAEKKGGE